MEGSPLEKSLPGVEDVFRELNLFFADAVGVESSLFETLLPPEGKIPPGVVLVPVLTSKVIKKKAMDKAEVENRVFLFIFTIQSTDKDSPAQTRVLAPGKDKDQATENLASEIPGLGGSYIIVEWECTVNRVYNLGPAVRTTLCKPIDSIQTP